MPEPIIKVTIVGMDKIEAKLKLLPDAVADAGIEAADNYLLRAIIDKETPQPKHVSRAQAYPGSFAVTPTGKRIQGYQSYKQFKFVRALVAAGKVPYRRTNETRNSWKIEGAGRTAFLTNNSPAAEWVYSEHQARLNQLVGWRRVSQIIDKYTKNIVAAFDRAVVKGIKKAGL